MLRAGPVWPARLIGGSSRRMASAKEEEEEECLDVVIIVISDHLSFLITTRRLGELAGALTVSSWSPCFSWWWWWWYKDVVRNLIVSPGLWKSFWLHCDQHFLRPCQIDWPLGVKQRQRWWFRPAARARPLKSVILLCRRRRSLAVTKTSLMGDEGFFTRGQMCCAVKNHPSSRSDTTPFSLLCTFLLLLSNSPAILTPWAQK